MMEGAFSEASFLCVRNHSNNLGGAPPTTVSYSKTEIGYFLEIEL